MGHLTLIMGCMFAQKTTEILRRIRRYQSIGYRVLVINYRGDTRYGSDCIASHDKDTFAAISLEHLDQLGQEYPNISLADYDVVVIDEGQFFRDLLGFVSKWVDTLPLHVVVSGLDGDAARRPFGQLLELIPHAEEVVRLSAYCASCKDGTVAHFSKRIVASAEQVLIGGADSYIPVCRKHYLGH